MVNVFYWQVVAFISLNGLLQFSGFVTTAQITSGPAVNVSAERRLISELLARYAKLGTIARPVINSSKCVEVQFGLRLVHLDLVEKEQMMRTSVWVRARWTDEYLKWDLLKFPGITQIVLTVNKIWTPDMALVNTGETEVKEQEARVLVKYNGLVTWAPQRKYSSACLIDVTEYPFDRHTCDMWFQSISNPSHYLNAVPYPRSPLDLDTYLSSYRHSQEWNIISNESTWYDKPRDVGMILMYSRRASLRFSLTVQRRPGFKGMLLIVPCALLSFLIPLVFCFPPERPDRHTLAMSLFASLTILLFMVNDVAPPSAAFVPRLALYYSFNLIVLLVATSCSVAVVNISRRGETRERVPKVFRVIFIKHIGKLLCFGKRLEHLNAIKRASRRIQASRNSSSPEPHLNENGETSFSPPTTVPELYPLQTLQESQNNDSLSAAKGNSMLLILNRKLNNIERKLNEKRSNDAALDISIPVDLNVEWRTLSLVLDRLFCVIFLITDIVSLAVFHPRVQR